jgi:ppGpp synthetase/RelA/SpoT-type nucleotidyltranferase
VVKNVKMSSVSGGLQSMDVEFEGHQYSQEMDIDPETLLESLRTSIESRPSQESVEQLEQRLKQLESIIRSKSRVGEDQIRSSFRNEVLRGRVGRNANTREAF